MSELRIDALKALAHPLRLRLLQALRDGERNVGELEGATQIGQPALSQQLSVLRKAGLVETRKQAKLVYYRLEAAPLSDLAKLIGELVSHDEAPEGERRRPSAGAANFARLS